MEETAYSLKCWGAGGRAPKDPPRSLWSCPSWGLSACQEGGDQEPHSLTKVKSTQLTLRPRYQKWALLQATLPGDVHTPGIGHWSTTAVPPHS